MQALKNCQVSTWLDAFEHLTYRTEIIELPDSWCKFLTADGVYVDESSKAMPVREINTDALDDEAYRDWSDEDEPEERSSHIITEAERAEMVEQINSCIARLGGAVSPKVNWSCPKDAVWVSTGSTHKCTNADEVILLLKSSDRVSHDICESLENLRKQDSSAHLTLALRKWHRLNPEREFRCFVRGDKLIGISQRDLSGSFPALIERKDVYSDVIEDFFEDHLQSKFAEPDYTFDIYLTSNGKVKLLDFNPVLGTTSPLLFSWEELGYSPPSATEKHPETDEGSATMAIKPAKIAEAQIIEGENVFREESESKFQDSRDRPFNASSAYEYANGADDKCALNSAELDELGNGENISNEVDFRIILGSNKVQPNMPTFGVPFDLIDNSDDSAYSDLVEKLRERQLKE